MCKLLGVLIAWLYVTIAISGSVAHAQNQTPTTSPILPGSELSYRLSLRLVGSSTTLPTLQSFASADYAGLWVIIGGRTNGLHQFTGNPLTNFPPSEQNRNVYVIDPINWQVWSRPLSDSLLSLDQVDELSASAYEHVQANGVLYIVGGYGYTRSTAQFQTYPMLSAIGLSQLIRWVREPAQSPDLSALIRQTNDEILRVTGGEMAIIGGRALLIFGQDFEGGYGSPNAVQTYTGQVRSFKIADTGMSVSIKRIKTDPETPDDVDFRRRDYNLALAFDGASQTTRAIALSGVFTSANGIFTVPVEVGRTGHPVQSDPTASTTFKQGSNSYKSALLGLYSTSLQQTHTILLGGITYVYFDPKTGQLAPDNTLPFTNQISAIVRGADMQYQQYLLEARFPTIAGPASRPLRFGADATFFVAPGIPTISNGLIDLDATLESANGKRVVVGWVFGGITAPAGSSDETFASSNVFEIALQAQSSAE